MHLFQQPFLKLFNLRGTAKSTHFISQFNFQINRPKTCYQSKMADSTVPTAKTEALYQKDGHLYTHSAAISTVQPLSSLPQDAQSLFKPPQEGDPYILTTPSTIFHAQGGGQPSDTGTITSNGATFTVHQVRKIDPAILHMGVFTDSQHLSPGTDAQQDIDVEKRILHSRIHTAGHVIGLAAAALKNDGIIDEHVVDGKASHYPGAAFVEFIGLIPGDKKAAIQAKTDDLVAQDLPVKIHFWDEQRARSECTGVLDSFKQDADDGVRVVEIGDVGSYPCGGTHVRSTKGCGRIVVRNIKRQKGITKVSYEVQDA